MGKTLGEKLKEARENKNLSITELAKEVEVSEGAIRSYERNDADPAFFTLCCIATALDVSLDYLAGFTKEPKIHIEKEWMKI